MSFKDKIKTLFSHKCCLCNKKHAEMTGQLVNYSSVYNELYKVHYHNLCLDSVLTNPRNYDSLTVDKAISLMERIDEDAERKRKEDEYRNVRLLAAQDKRDRLSSIFVESKLDELIEILEES